jgi:hypothetical protein
MLQAYVLHTLGVRMVLQSLCGGPDPRPGMRGKRLLRDDLWMFQACVLGLPCKVKFDSESSVTLR